MERQSFNMTIHWSVMWSDMQINNSVHRMVLKDFINTFHVNPDKITQNAIVYFWPQTLRG